MVSSDDSKPESGINEISTEPGGALVFGRGCCNKSGGCEFSLFFVAISCLAAKSVAFNVSKSAFCLAPSGACKIVELEKVKRGFMEKSLLVFSAESSWPRYHKGVTPLA